MMAKIKFKELYKEELLFETEKEFANFFTELKNDFCKDIMEGNIPLMTLSGSFPSIERIEILSESSYTDTEEGFQYKGTFKVVGVRSKNLYDSVTIELSNIRFLKKVNINDYIGSILKLRYTGSLIKLEDIEAHSKITNKEMCNNRTITLKKMSDESELLQLTLDLEKQINHKNFEVNYTSLGSTQSYFCYYNEEKERSYLKDLCLQTKNYDITIRVIDNDLYESYLLATGAINPKIRKAI